MTSSLMARLCLFPASAMMRRFAGTSSRIISGHESPHRLSAAPSLLFQNHHLPLLHGRTMAGGPRNPEHKNLTKEEKQARRAAKRNVILAKTKPPSDKTSNAMLRLLEQPIPKDVKPYMANLETYIIQEWIPQFPSGARLRKLQRDVTWRMNRKISPGRLEYDHLLPVVGELVRKGLLDTRFDNKAGKLVIVAATKNGDRKESSGDNNMNLPDSAA